LEKGEKNPLLKFHDTYLPENEAIIGRTVSCVVGEPYMTRKDVTNFVHSPRIRQLKE
jgi:hypothetical protein